MKKARIIYANGTEKEISPKNGKDFQLEELQKIVEGYIEVLPIHDGEIMIMNEEGKINGLPINKKATEIVSDIVCDVIVGNVLICNSKMLK